MKTPTFFEWYAGRENGDSSQTAWIKKFATELAWENHRDGEARHDGDCTRTEKISN